jgi:hypothetical protein
MRLLPGILASKESKGSYEDSLADGGSSSWNPAAERKRLPTYTREDRSQEEEASLDINSEEGLFPSVTVIHPVCMLRVVTDSTRWASLFTRTQSDSRFHV